MIHYIETNSTDPFFNLAFEEYILENEVKGDWLMLWQNDNAVIIGRNQDAEAELNLPYVKNNSIKVVRRKTGGGAVYHDLGNLNYSFICDFHEDGRDSLSRFTQPVCRALQSMGLEAECSGRNDILIQGKKVSGVAQRIYKNRILHHGTLLFSSDLEKLSAALKPDREKLDSKAVKSVRSRVCNIKELLAEEMSLEQFHHCILSELSGGDFVTENLSPAGLSLVEKKAESYRREDLFPHMENNFNFYRGRRFEAGTLRIELQLENGLIKAARISGDFMAMSGCDELLSALSGIPFEAAVFEKVLDSFDTDKIFPGIGKEDILKLIFQ